MYTFHHQQSVTENKENRVRLFQDPASEVQAKFPHFFCA